MNKNLLDSITEYKESKKYWEEKLSGVINEINFLRNNKGVPETEKNKKSNYDININSQLSFKLLKMCKNNDLSLYVIMMTALKVLLYKYTGETDISIAGPIYADSDELYEYNNKVIFRDFIKENMTFKELLINVKQTVSEAYLNQHYPMDKVLEKLQLENELSSMYRVAFFMESIHNQECIEDIIDLSENYITISISKTEDILNAKVLYNTSIFTEKSIKDLIDRFINVMNQSINNIEQKIENIEIVTEEEKQKLLFNFNDTKTEYPKDKTIYELFEEQAKRTPDNIAVVYKDEKLTYKELNERANSLAKILREKGVKSESIVGIMVERSLEMIIGIFGIMKAGGAYLPIDPEYPEERISYMLKDSGCNLVLTQTHLIDSISYISNKINLENQEIYEQQSSENDKNLNRDRKPSDLAYVIYTSGSTGKPKGVMVEHRNIYNTIQWRKSEYNLNFNDNVLQLFSFSFDGFLTSFFTPIVSGAKVTLLNENDAKDPVSIKNIIKNKQITHFICVPPLYNAILECSEGEDLKTLRIVTLAGDKVTNKLVVKSKEKNSNIEVINEYGPTENSVATSIARNLDPDTNITIGKPIANTNVYILDKSNKLVGIEMPGELCVSGNGVARGYFKRPNLTEEKFIENPFNKEETLYKTGDLARWLPDGSIDFLGRIDYQVKIRGYRIELGEIERHLLTHTEIKEVVVIDRESENKEKYLCGYVVFNESDKEISIAQLREYLSDKLPEYMIPAYFIQMDKLPLTPNGKIDRKALPKPDEKIDIGVEYEPPRNDVECKLVEIWEYILEKKEIGINDNFFYLGGDSLKATTLVAKIYKELNIEIPLQKIFKSPSIKEISQVIDDSNESNYTLIKPIEEREYYPLSPAQNRMYILDKFSNKSTNYNMPSMIEIHGELDVERLEKTFEKLITRHESLRTSFEIIEDEPVQKIHSREKISFRVEVHNLEEFKLNLGNKDIENKDNSQLIEEKLRELASKFIRPFELKKVPLLRVGLIKFEENKYLFMTDMHHIISDGVSTAVLMKEFSQLYNGGELSELEIQYKDYAVWQREDLDSKELKKQEKYWLNKFEGEIPVLDIPSDYSRPPVQSFEGDRVSFKIDNDLKEELRKLSDENQATLYITLLAVYNIFLYKYTGNKDIIVGSPIAGRQHPDLQKIIGMFVNTLAMRNNPSGEKTFIEFLKEVRENALEAYENQDYQFDELVEKLDIERNTGRNPLFDTMFTLQSMDIEDINLDGLNVLEYNFDNMISKFDITLNTAELPDGISFNIEYSTKLFKKETIERISGYFVNILKEIKNNPQIKLSEIEIITEKEKNQILNDVNNTKTEYPKGKTIHELFEEQVLKTPDKVAVSYKNKGLTYEELNKKANKLAKLLRNKGVKEDTIISIMADKSLEMIIGVLGILKSGGAYLPIASHYPMDRIKYMLEDSKADILLTQERYREELEFNGEIICLDDTGLYDSMVGNDVEDIINIENINKPRDLAYIMYTSGSIGKPKGVMVEHRPVVRLVKNTNYLQITKEDRILQTGSIVFDASTLEIWGSLLNGATLYLEEKAVILDAEKLSKALKENQISIIWLTSSLFNQLADQKPDMFKPCKYLLVGGDVVSPKHVRKVKEECKGLKVINGYGPTENTTFSTCFLIEKDYENSIPIGKPIANSKAYVLHTNVGTLQPVGTVGELCVAGDGLSRGYLNNPELTREKFIENPFETGEKMYKTGDLVKLLPNGNIEFIGRKDNQIKLRGFRIELGEIENRILKHKDIKEVVVLAREDENNNKYLCGYIVGDKEISTIELKEYLLEELPEYMIPSYFIQLDKMPLTINGKVNRKELPEPEEKIETGVEYEAPRNEIEEKLVEIWEEVLRLEKVGINDNFFDLGGHSLKATTLTSKIHKELKIEVPLKEVFKYPTIKGISKYIGKSKESKYSSIQSVEEREYYPLSSAQNRMYILNQFDKKSTNYNIPSILEIKGKLDIGKLKNVFEKLITRHESLRTSFKTREEEPVQIIHDEVESEIDYIELDELIFNKNIYVSEEKLEEVTITKDSTEVHIGNFNIEESIFDTENNTEEILRMKDELIQSIVKDFMKAFDLSKAPLLRVVLVKIEEEKYILMIDMHHIISDGVSTEILTSEFASLYSGQKLPELRIQYKDYALWQQEQLQEEDFKKQEEYWLERFEGEIPVLNMHTDYQRPPVKSFEGDSISFKVDKDIKEKLNEISKENGSTMYMTLLTAYNTLLHKYTGQEDIIVGSPIAGRPHADLENIMGMFVNTLAMRNYPTGEKTFKKLLLEVKENALKSYENQDYQFEDLVEKLDIQRDISRNPLFDTMFALQNMDINAVKMENLTIAPYKYENKVSKFDIKLTAIEIKEEIYFNFEYCTDLFKRETIERLNRHFVNILERIAENPEIKLNELEIMTEDEKELILIDFNNTKVDYPKSKTIHQIFEEQVKRIPDDVAIVYKDNKLTYRKLNEKANSLARKLRQKGVKQDDIVGIMVDRSMEMIIGIMAILKSGGAYLPIDPEYPQNRISYMLEDSQTKVLVTESRFIEVIGFEETIINIKDESTYKEEVFNLENLSDSNNLAYVIYTSGSTGKPKGVMIEHRSVCNFMKGMVSRIKFEQLNTVLSLTTMSFDIFVFETLLPLVKGLKVVIAGDTDTRDSNAIGKLILENKVDLLQATPSRMKLILNDLKSPQYLRKLKTIAIGGEAFPIGVLEGLRNISKTMKIYNMYGPTETTIWSTIKDLTEYSEVNIGKPISNTEILILDKYGNISPIGVKGELCIGGEGLARGYLNRPDLTSEKFESNPFKDYERIYRTGDLARWLPDGNIEFIGRVDNQVKIRGYRIEIGEIEKQLLNHQDIKEVIVIDKETHDNNKYLCSYIISKKEINTGQLREYLLKKLPHYMIPSYFIKLEEMPLTPNGKIDRNALPEPYGVIETGEEYEEPRNETEEMIVAIWKEILGVEKVGINDDFFNLGGHSLKATTLISRIHKELNIEVPLQEIFKTPTIREISKYIRNSNENIYSSIEPVEEKEYYPLSSAQKRMYILNRFSKDIANYNMPWVLEIEGELDRVKLEDTFNKLINRHESLRTSFELVEEEPVQRIHKEIGFKINYIELDEIDFNDFIKPFDLNKAPLLRVGLVKIDQNKYILMTDMHHIISDGVSTGILISEFAKLYSGEKLPQLRIQYKDYSVWQQEQLQTKDFKKKEKYWLERFKVEVPVLNLATDYPRPSVQSFEGDNLSFKVDKDIKEKLQEISKINGSTMYMTLLALYNTLLYKYTGQEDIVVGSPIAGRPHNDLQNILGMFVNTLAMRNYPKGEKTFIQLLTEVKENALSAYKNQDYQFEDLVEKLDVKRDTSRNPLFDTMFTLQNMSMDKTELDELKISTYNIENKVSKFDISLNAIEGEDGIYLNLEYCTKLFKQGTIERLSKHFINILEEISNNPEIKLSELDVVSEEEKRQILVGFNDTKAEYPKNKTIYKLFEEQAALNSENIAVKYENKKITYRELNEKANQLARVLRQKGVGTDSVVGIMVERTIEMIIGVMAVLKAGGAYMPINPDYPDSRMKYMLEDSHVNILLTHDYLSDRSLLKEGQILVLENQELYQGCVSNLDDIDNKNESDNHTKNATYVIYTSGSTGKPKGVIVEHRSLNNFLHTMYDKFDGQLGIGDNCLSLTNISFDVGVCEIFLPLVFGGTLVFLNSKEVLDIRKLAKTMLDEEITFSYIPPTILTDVYKLLEEQKDRVKLNKMLVGVEPIKDYVLDDYLSLNRDMKIINGYGPTEATICATMYTYGGNEPKGVNVPIGKPLNNTQIYILDKYKNPVPVRVKGELCISGDGLARGYLNKPELTAGKFVNNPFSEGEKMYRTGDLAMWNPDGNIQFIGRIDHQVKIRGYRIELGEIENQLLKHRDVKETAVLVKERKNKDKYICCYFVADKKIAISKIKEFLGRELPEYMIPTYFIQIDSIPLTANGKLNRKALPEPDGKIDTEAEYEAPRNKIEETLCNIWEEVLEVKDISINDNFFDLGGHSLKATILVSKIHKKFNVEMPLHEIFKTPTIKGVYEYIRNSEGNMYNSIESVEERENYPLSSAQKRMYILNQFNKNTTNYNIPTILEIEGKLDLVKLENVFRELVNRHESLRTSFEILVEEPIQIVHDEVEFKIEDTELENLSHTEEISIIKEELTENMLKNFTRPFDLSKPPLLRVGLIKVEEEKYILMIDMHHIISDGVSKGILISEFTKLYNKEELPELRIQYKDYSVWQQEQTKKENFKKQENYWLKKFKGELPVLNFPTDYPRPVIQSFEGNNISFEVDINIKEKLNEISKRIGSTLYMTLLAAYNVLLYKYTGQEDIVVGSPIAGRPHSDLQNIIGMFVNALAMRNKPERDKSFEQLLVEVKENALNAFENQDYQFEELVEKLNITRDSSKNPIFDTMFSLQNMNRKGDITELDGLKISPYSTENKISKFDITLNAVERENGIYFNLEYSTKLFKKETIKRFSEHFKNVIEQIVNKPDTKINEIDILSKKEKEQIIYHFNNSILEYPKNKTIVQLFEEQVKLSPEKISIVCEKEKLSYRELNERANSLARILRYDKNIRTNDVVGILVNQSLEMFIGIMSVLKAGGTYLPIDPKYPKSRINYMLEDSKAKVLLTQSKFIDNIDNNKEFSIKLNHFDGIVINLEDNKLYSLDKSNLSKVDVKECLNKPNHLAYIIYTSGSTGKPKGVMVEHKSLVNLCYWHNREFGVTENDKATKYAGIGFDASVWEIFPYLIKGGEIHIIDDEIRLDVNKLNEYFEENNISISFLPTQLCEQFMEINNTSLRKLLTGGDKLKQYEERNYDIVNNYGPTECTVVATSFTIDKNYDNLPIGKPISNAKVYILDKDNNLTTIGVAGELCIAGDGLARGYLNRADLTEKAFTNNPFVRSEKMYRTGDLARWLPDGNIEFLGRIDSQVQIRGFRVELGEIENQLLSHEYIKEAVVIDREDELGSKYLCGYIVANMELDTEKDVYMYEEKNINFKGLREYLSKELPDYMIPSYIMELEEMPLTPNGKIDRKALPKPDGKMDTGVEYVAPRDETEEILVNIWEEILNTEKVGIKDNFFELGGHSLKATTLVSKIHKRLNVEIPLNEVFKNPNVEKMAEYIRNSSQNEYFAIEQVEKKEYYPLSSAQKRLYVLNHIEEGTTNYNTPSILEIEGEVDVEKLKQIFNELVDRHESLRTSFEIVEGEPVQRIHYKIQLNIDCNELQTPLGYNDYEITKDKEIKGNIKDFIRPFDLSKAPLIRVRILKISEYKYMLMTDTHHIISDGVSTEILINEFVKLYKGEELPKLRLQYKDYSNWQQNNDTKELKKQGEYWLGKFKGNIPVLDIPTDCKRPTVLNSDGAVVEFSIKEEETRQISKLASKYMTTKYTVLLAVYNILLSKLSGQEDIIIGTVTSGRNHADLENIVGMFVNTLVLRNYPTSEKTFEEFLNEVRDRTLEDFENQDYQFEDVIKTIGIKRDGSRNPLFDIVFEMQNFDSGKNQSLAINIKHYNSRNDKVKFDLSLVGLEAEGTLKFKLKYRTQLFRRETIERFVANFKNILSSIIIKPNMKISHIEILPKDRKAKMIEDFNDEFNNMKLERIRNTTIQQRLFEGFRKYNTKTAIKIGQNRITYGELDDKSNYIANWIIEKGIKKGTFIGIYTDDKVELITNIIGILKTGCVFIPLDTSYPNKRIENMIRVSEVDIILTDAKNYDTLSSIINIFNTSTIHISNDIPVSFNEPHNDIRIINLDNETTNNIYLAYSEIAAINLGIKVEYNPDDKIYVYFTSGSTGMPKAIVGKNNSLLHFIEWEIEEFKVDEDFKVGQFTRIGFDAFLRDVFVPICAGGMVCIPENEDISMNSHKLVEWIDSEDINLIHCVPSYFRIINSESLTQDKFKDLKYILMSGDRINPYELNEWYSKFGDRVQLVNLYGATETTMIKTCYPIKKEDVNKDRIPVGKPINGTKVIILDKDNNISDIGVAGEIYIRTPFTTYGYYNKAELNKEKFVQNPLSDEKEDLVFKTGDLGRLLSDGSIDLLGRIDRQVKIRGNRIELNEIENVIHKYNHIKEVVVSAKTNDDGEKHLCAYIVSNKELVISELREYLRNELPDYMIPSYFMQLEEMPLTFNGKIDRKVLPEPDGKMNTGVEYEAPLNEIEERLVEIWESSLGVEKIGTNDNFFDLGGHSLKATTLISKIHKELNIEVPIQAIFKKPTVKRLAEYISELNVSTYNSIEPVEERENYQVSSTQKRIYILQQFEGLTTSYNMTSIMEIEGYLDIDKLKLTFHKLVKRHESLRTSFDTVDGEIVQIIKENVNFKVEVQICEECEIKEEIRTFVKPFILNEAPLIRVKLLKLDNEKYILMIDMHHIISDGSSVTILINDFIRLYEDENLGDIKITYKDYSAWENKRVESGIMDKKKEYWLEEFKGEIPVLEITTDYPRPRIKNNEGGSYKYTINKKLLSELKGIAKNNNTTLFTVLLGIFSVTLSKYTGQEDVVVGTVTAGRTKSELDNIIGVFLNNIAIRCMPKKDKTFKEYLNILKEKVLDCFDNEEYPIEQLIDDLKLKKDTSRNSLFDVMLILQNFYRDTKEFSSFKIKPYDFEHTTSKYDMTLYAIENNDELVLRLEYSTSIFKKETMENFINHFKNVAEEIVECADKVIYKIEILNFEEKKRISRNFNNTTTEYPKHKTIQEIFEEQVEKNPNKVAVVYGEEQLTYRELNKKSNQVARVLIKSGVKAESVVGIMIDRSLEMIVGILGIIKSGGAYLPIDSEYPLDRIVYMLEDSNTNILLTKFLKSKDEDNTINIEDIINDIEYKGKIIDLADEKIYEEESSNLDNTSKPEDLLYIIYTSGSTGRPKGVMIEHKNLVNVTYGWRKYYELETMEISLLQMASFSFDVFTGDLSKSLLNGGKMVICPRDMRTNSKSLFSLMKKHDVNMLESTPALMVPFMEYVYDNGLNIDNLKLLIVGSDICKSEDFNRLNQRYFDKMRIVNSYGVTEATIDTSLFELEDKNSKVEINVPIGKPMQNTELYILDDKNNILPIGVYGELCISGVGVARGYLNKEELTKKKFVENPFAPNSKMYKTGDIARWMGDGNVEFIGRKDNQVKVRGFRIELGEIENQLLNYQDIKEAVVVAKEDEDKNKYLCGYIIGTGENKEITVAKLRNHLSRELPEYMIPSFFIELEKMPLTPNGKIDRKALPEPNGKVNTGSVYEEPSNKTEEILVKMWEDILGMSEISINDNFFELGGHSIKLVSFVSRIKEEFGIELSIKQVLNTLTIKEIAKIIIGEYSEKAEESVVLLNGLKINKIFCFPPMTGYGISYKSLSNILSDYSIYAFNYIEEENVIEKYIDIITEIQPEGPYVLLGYSLGGRLAFHIATELEKRGYQVSNIILIDTHKEVKKTDDPVEFREKVEEYKKMITIRMENDEQYSMFKDEVVRKSTNYFKFALSIVDTKIVNGNIHLIESSHRDKKRDLRENSWEKSTHKKYEVYEGFGTHLEMLDDHIVKQNGEVIKKLLNSIFKDDK